MPDPTQASVCASYFSVHVSNRATSERGTGWVWSRPFATAQEAMAEQRRLVAEGSITLGFVAQIGPEGKRVLVGRTWPGAAGKAIERYLELVEMLEGTR